MQDPGILIGYTTVESHLPQIINSTIAPNYAQNLFIGLDPNMFRLFLTSKKKMRFKIFDAKKISWSLLC